MWRRSFALIGIAACGHAAACGGAAVSDGDRANCSADGGTDCANAAPESDRVCKAPTQFRAPPCPDGYYLYADRVGGPDPGGGHSSAPVGDQLCHQICKTDADCTDPCHPSCHTLGLFAGGDYNCNSKVRVCGTETVDHC